MQTTPAFPHRQDVFRRIILLGIPLILCLLELGHPLLDHKNPIRMLAPIATWWITLHVLLIPLFALMGWAFYLLLQDIHSPAAMISRWAMAIHVVFAIGYDTAVGLNTGILVSNALSLPNTQQVIIQQAMHLLFASPAIILSYYILLGAGIVAICTAAWALFRAGVPRLPIFALLGMVLSIYSHALPFGPLGSACFFLAALWMELVWRKASPREKQTSTISPVPQFAGSLPKHDNTAS